jgi:hypothetical protein
MSRLTNVNTLFRAYLLNFLVQIDAGARRSLRGASDSTVGSPEGAHVPCKTVKKRCDCRDSFLVERAYHMYRDGMPLELTGTKCAEGRRRWV